LTLWGAIVATYNLICEDFSYLFLLNENFSLEKLRPKSVTKQLDPYFPLPPNVNRRYLRTKLYERGCSNETINCFMGHWSSGEEPWGRFSSFSYLEYAKEIKKHIPDILNELGFSAHKSHVST